LSTQLLTATKQSYSNRYVNISKNIVGEIEENSRSTLTKNNERIDSISINKRNKLFSLLYNVLLKKGGVDITLNNEIYKEHYLDSGFVDVPATYYNRGFTSHFLQIRYSISDRFNIGLNSRYRFVTFSNRSEDRRGGKLSFLEILDIKYLNDNDVYKNIESFGTNIWFAPFKNVNHLNFSLGVSFAFPELLNKSNFDFYLKSSPSLYGNINYAAMIHKKLLINLTSGITYENIDKESIRSYLSFPTEVSLNYFPINKLNIFTTTYFGHYDLYSNEEINKGHKGFLVKQHLGLIIRLAQKFDVIASYGFRYTNEKNYSGTFNPSNKIYKGSEIDLNFRYIF